MSEKKPNWLLRSRAYLKAVDLVSGMTASPSRLIELVARAQGKLTKRQGGKFNDILNSVTASFRLIKAYAAGDYRDISLESLGLIVASIIYFVMPLDVLPDFIVGLGLTDDAALFAWTLRSVAGDLERFMQWENSLDAENSTED